MSAPFSIVCLSTQDWRSDLPTNRQQIMRRAGERGHEVLFVETGSFLGSQLVRLAVGSERRSLARRLVATEDVAEHIRTRKALNVAPWRGRFRSANAIDATTTSLAVRLAARGLPRPVVLWVYDPASAWLIGSCGEDLAVYDCVDDYVEQAGTDPHRRRLTARADVHASKAAGLVFTTTTPLFERHKRLNPATHLVRNMGDFDHFRPAADRSLAAPETAGLPRPVVGFAGNFLESKVDFELLERLARARPDWTLLLVGPGHPETQARLDELVRFPNVHWLGPKPYAELPRYTAAFDVGLIPYVANEYTRSCFPLKVFEYLAAGLPVVATGLPELRGLAPEVTLASGAEQTQREIEDALGRLDGEHRERRIALAAQNTWDVRTSRLLGLVGAQLGSNGA
jgi:glycosyltransferase involved in cell wall biosynthesis